MANVSKSSMNADSNKINLSSLAASDKQQKAALKEKRTEAKKLQAEIEAMEKKNQQELNAEEKKHLQELLDLKKKNAQEIQDLEDKREEARNEVSKKLIENASSAAASAISDGVSKIKSNLENTMSKFLETQESIAYNLNGTELNVSKINEDLTNAIAGTGIVRQEAVYNKINELVKQGIVYNVEQRAFLATLSDDLDTMFNATDGSLVRLINLQRTDLTDNRMAIQTSLKTFLNQNYETSQYIKKGFEDVSTALLEAQSIMTVDSGMKLEATLQKWLGSLSSVGMSDQTINALATAIGQVGSGNLSALSNSSMQNLIVMGAAQQGISYADLLTQGISSTTADALMQGIVSYIAQMGNNSSNVVKSEYARIFGINVSDIVAASQVGNVSKMADLTTDISEFLKSTGDYIYASSRVNKGLENFMYEWATGVASSEVNYGLYRVLDVVSGIGAALTAGMTVSTPKIFGAGADIELSKVISMAPLLATIGSLADTIGDTANNLFGSQTGADSIFNKLGVARDQYIKATGALTGFSKTSGLETSGSMIITNTSTSDMANTAMTSSGELVSQTMKGEEETYDITDLYKLYEENWNNDVKQGIKYEMEVFQHNTLNDIYNYLVNSLTPILTQTLPLILSTQTYPTYTRIAEAANTVTIGNDLTTAFDLMMISTMHLSNIYGLLAKFTGATDYVTQVAYESGKNPWNESLDWLTPEITYNETVKVAEGG